MTVRYTSHVCDVLTQSFTDMFFASDIPEKASILIKANVAVRLLSRHSQFVELITKCIPRFQLALRHALPRQNFKIQCKYLVVVILVVVKPSLTAESMKTQSVQRNRVFQILFRDDGRLVSVVINVFTDGQKTFYGIR